MEWEGEGHGIYQCNIRMNELRKELFVNAWW
jgi:hypothetical protein